MSKKKNKNNQLPAVKAIWEEYANIVLEEFVELLDSSIEGLHAGHPIIIAQRPIIDKMREFKFDFNK